MVSLGVGAAVRSRWGGDLALVTALVLGLLLAPLLAGAAVFLVWAGTRFVRARAQKRRGDAAVEAALEVAELIGLGLAGGLSVPGAHRLALEHCPDAGEKPLRDLVDSIERVGAVPALGMDRGVLAGTSRVLVTATASGAPVLPALEAYLQQQHHRRHTAAVEAARRLPIRLLIPLTLLVLPGFVLITVGPAVIDSLARLNQ